MSSSDTIHGNAHNHTSGGTPVQELVDRGFPSAPDPIMPAQGQAGFAEIKSIAHSVNALVSETAPGTPRSVVLDGFRLF